LDVARIREAVTEVALGEIRLQWWSDTIDAIYAGELSAVPSVPGLAETIAEGGLSREHFTALLAARRADFADRPMATMDDLRAHAEGTSSRLMLLALEVLDVHGEAAEQAAGHAGIATALVGLVRASRFLGRQGRLYLPTELLAAEDVPAEAVMAGRFTPALGRVVGQVLDLAEDHARRARARRRQVPRAALPALWPMSLAMAHARDLRRNGCDPFAPDPAVAPLRAPLSLVLRSLSSSF
jgi:phytoene synthase